MKKRLKIFEVLPALSCGGAERFAVDLSNELSRCNDVTMIVLSHLTEKDFLADELNKNIRLISVKSFNSPIGWILTMIKFWWLVIRLRPDVVHLHLYSILFARLAIYLHWPSAKYIYTVHNDAFLDADNVLGARKKLFERKLVWPVTISQESEKSFERAYQMSAPIFVNGCRNISIEDYSNTADDISAEVRSWRADEESLLIINVARIVPQKNQIILAQSVAKLAEEGLNIDLVIIGNAADQSIKQQIESLKCSRVHLAGQKNNPLPYLAQADAFCLSSVFEGLPITLLEAFALGIPACVTPVGGMKNLVIDGENGLVADGVEVEDIAAMLRRFCSLAPEKRAVMKENAVKSFQPYTMEVCAGKYHDLMTELIDHE